jgi:DSF synthase
MRNDRVRVEFDLARKTLWIFFRPAAKEVHTFSWAMLKAWQAVLHEVERLQQDKDSDAVHYIVVGSDHPQYFSLGGDLEYFLECIRRDDAQGLREYATFSLDMIYRSATVLNRYATTISLVQGRALGGGFEAALAADHILAEEHAEFGFPEILFGLFPVSGGLNLLERRVPLKQAEMWMVKATVLGARAMHEAGVVDQICPRGQGRQAVQAFIDEHAKRRKARVAMRNSLHRMQKLDYQEMLHLVDDWVRAARSLTQQELRVLDTLVRMQRTEMAL